MWSVLWAVLGMMRSLLRTRRKLALENLALRQQVAVLIRTRGARRLRLGVWDRTLWTILSQGWAGWREAVAIVGPATVIRWHREGFRRFWKWRSRPRHLGRPGLDREVVRLIRRIAQANVTWGAPGMAGQNRAGALKPLRVPLDWIQTVWRDDRANEWELALDGVVSDDRDRYLARPHVS